MPVSKEQMEKEIRGYIKGLVDCGEKLKKSLQTARSGYANKIKEIAAKFDKYSKNFSKNMAAAYGEFIKPDSKVSLDKVTDDIIKLVNDAETKVTDKSEVDNLHEARFKILDDIRTTNNQVVDNFFTQIDPFKEKFVKNCSQAAQRQHVTIAHNDHRMDGLDIDIVQSIEANNSALLNDLKNDSTVDAIISSCLPILVDEFEKHIDALFDYVKNATAKGKEWHNKEYNELIKKAKELVGDIKEDAERQHINLDSKQLLAFLSKTLMGIWKGTVKRLREYDGVKPFTDDETYWIYLRNTLLNREFIRPTHDTIEKHTLFIKTAAYNDLVAFLRTDPTLEKYVDSGSSGVQHDILNVIEKSYFPGFNYKDHEKDMQAIRKKILDNFMRDNQI